MESRFILLAQNTVQMADPEDISVSTRVYRGSQILLGQPHPLVQAEDRGGETPSPSPPTMAIPSMAHCVGIGK